MAKCPHCDKPFSITPRTLEQETVTMHITWEGAMIEAKTIGGVIENTRKLLVAVAKDAGMSAYIGMSGIEFGDGEAKLHFAVIDKAKRGRPDGGVG